MIDILAIKKILILRYRFVGDTVLSIPFIKNVRENFPNAQIDILVSPNSGELLEGNQCLDRVMYLKDSTFHKYEKSRDAACCVSTRSLRKENYDLAFVLKRSFSSALLAWLSGAKYRIGFSTEFRSFLLTHTVQYDKNLHEADNFLNCLKPLGIGVIPQKYIPEIFPSEEEKRRANGFVVRLDKFKPKILIHATSAHPYKQYPKRYFAKLIDFLFESHGAQFVFTGAKEDKKVYESILDWSRNKNKIKYLNLCGLTTLRECFPLYSCLDLAICVDSGNAHIASATGIPTYVLYGPTNPQRWLPLGKNVYPIMLDQFLPCQPCDVKVKCNHLSCMKLLVPEHIFGKLSSIKKYQAVEVT